MTSKDITGVQLQTLLDSLPVPVFVVDDRFRVQGANSKGYALLVKKPDQVLEKLSGEVFECANARLPEGCGRTIHCTSCAIRRSISHTFATGESRHEVPATLHCGEPATPEDVNMRISTEKMGDVVLLQVNKFRE